MIVFNKLNEFLEEKDKIKYYQMIDYTKIKPNMSSDEVKSICKEAEANHFYSICVLPDAVNVAHSFLGADVKISCLIDFPKGQSSIKEKVREIEDAIVSGAKEVDVVINYDLIKDEDMYEDLDEEIRKVTEVTHRECAIIKAIIEVGYLTYQEIEKICNMCVESGVDYIMTSTGKLKNDNSFDERLEKVKYIRKIVPDDTKIKFSGGIRSIDQIQKIMSIVDRVGTSVIPQ